MSPRRDPETSTRTRRRIAGATAVLAVAGLTLTPHLAGGPAAAMTTPGARAATALEVPQLAPQRVEADRIVSVPVKNDTDSAIDVTGTATMAQKAAGSGSTHLGPGASGRVPLTLTSAAMSSLRAHNWGAAAIHLTSQAGSADRSLVLVPTSYTPKLSANPSNPLAGVPWANFTGKQEPVWDTTNKQSYPRATLAAKNQLAPVALNPKARWFGGNTPPSQLGGIVKSYVDEARAADPNALVQLTMFTISPWETDATKKVPTKAQVQKDKAYINQFARGIGDARAAVVVEPDGPYAAEGPNAHNKTLRNLVKYAVQRLGKLPRTAAYIDMGSADWHRGEIGKEWPLLLDEGIKQARGISMDVTHADSTKNQIFHAQKLFRTLAKHGVTAAHQHAVVDTSDNGRPFGGADWQQAHKKGAISAAPVCTNAKGKLCLVVGIPPTTDVSAARWKLGSQASKLAAKYVDAYLWVKRPWCNPAIHGYPFESKLGADSVKYSPFF